MVELRKSSGGRHKAPKARDFVAVYHIGSTTAVGGITPVPPVIRALLIVSGRTYRECLPPNVMDWRSAFSGFCACAMKGGPKISFRFRVIIFSTGSGGTTPARAIRRRSENEQTLLKGIKITTRRWQNDDRFRSSETKRRLYSPR